MKIRIKDGFVLRQIADTWVVIAIGETMMDFNGMMTLNETGVFLWNSIGEENSIEALTQALTKEYEVSHAQAEEDVKAFCDKLVDIGCAEYSA